MNPYDKNYDPRIQLMQNQAGGSAYFPPQIQNANQSTDPYTLNALAGRPQTNPATIPVITSDNLYKSALGTTNNPLETAEMNLANSYKPVDYNANREETLRGLQSQIDSTNAYWISQANRVRQEQEKLSTQRSGATTSYLARSGAVGSSFGNAKDIATSELNTQSTDQALALVEQQRNEAINAIKNEGINNAKIDAETQRKANIEGSQARLDMILGKDKRIADNTLKASTQALSNDIDLTTIDPQYLTEIADSWGVSVPSLLASYRDQKQAREIAIQKASQEQQKAQAELNYQNAQTQNIGTDNKYDIQKLQQDRDIAIMNNNSKAKSDNSNDYDTIQAYAQQIASTGKTTGIPSKYVGNAYREARNYIQPGQLIDKKTGVTPDVSDAVKSAYAAGLDSLDKLDEIKIAFNKINTGILGGIASINPSQERVVFNTLRTDFVDLLARARTGAVINTEEQAKYENLLPGNLNEILGIGANGNATIDALKKSLQDTINSKMKTNGYGIAQGQVNNQGNQSEEQQLKDAGYTDEQIKIIKNAN